MLSEVFKRIRNISPQTLLPILLFITIYQLALLDYICTIIALVIFIILSYVMSKHYLDTMPDYFMIWTFASIVICYTVFVIGSFVLDVSTEGTLLVSCCVFLFSAFIDKIRAISYRHRASNLPSGNVQKHGNFCPECQFYCPKKPNHQYWLGTCIFYQNRIYYIIVLILMAFTSGVSGYLILKRLCQIGLYTFKKCEGIYYYMDITIFFINGMYTFWLVCPFLLYKIVSIGIQEFTNFRV